MYVDAMKSYRFYRAALLHPAATPFFLQQSTKAPLPILVEIPGRLIVLRHHSEGKLMT